MAKKKIPEKYLPWIEARWRFLADHLYPCWLAGSALPAAVFPEPSKEPCFSLGVFGVVARRYSCHGICPLWLRMSGRGATIVSTVVIFGALLAHLGLELCLSLT